MKAIKGQLHSLKKLRQQLAQRVENPPAELKKKPQSLSTTPSQGLSLEDKALFKQSLKGVIPLANSNRVDRTPSLRQHPEFFQAKREQAQGKETPPAFKRTLAPASRPIPSRQGYSADDYLAHGMGKDVLQKLKQLHWPVEATLDLHGATLVQATQRFDRFVATCLEHGIRCFMIVHGKGYGSREGKTVLKPQVMSWLRDMDAIAAFTAAPEPLGGDGALLVLSKRLHHV